MKARGFDINNNKNNNLSIPALHITDVAFTALIIATFAYLALI
jgi:hypothetical protein